MAVLRKVDGRKRTAKLDTKAIPKNAEKERREKIKAEREWLRRNPCGFELGEGV